jgi:hypothetical protein
MQGLGLRVQGLGNRDLDLEFRVQRRNKGLSPRIQSLRVRVEGLGVKGLGLGMRV